MLSLRETGLVYTKHQDPEAVGEKAQPAHIHIPTLFSPAKHGYLFNNACWEQFLAIPPQVSSGGVLAGTGQNRITECARNETIWTIIRYKSWPWLTYQCRKSSGEAKWKCSLSSLLLQLKYKHQKEGSTAGPKTKTPKFRLIATTRSCQHHKKAGSFQITSKH